jgi:hypothetical protein
MNDYFLKKLYEKVNKKIKKEFCNEYSKLITHIQTLRPREVFSAKNIFVLVQ